MRIIVNIDVPDLAPAIEFYCAALGLQLNRIIEDDIAELGGASTHIYLLQNPAGPDVTNARLVTRHYDRHWTPVHMDFVVDNIKTATQRALAAGAIQESKCVTWRGSKCITFSDPFGHGFCLIEFEAGTYE